MKKYLIMLSACLVIILVLNINLQWNNTDQDKFGITLSNIEALANSENDPRECYYSGSLDCPRYANKVKYIL